MDKTLKHPDTDKTLILGIDPGFTGALALIEATGPDQARLITVIDMPLLKPSIFEKRPRPDIDVATLAAWLHTNAHKVQLCVVEKVSAAPGQGVVSMFRFGQGFGIIQGVCGANGLKMLYPGPSVWKASMNLNRNKTRSIQAATSLVAGAEPFLKRIKDHGRAEAMLLALFGARSLAKGTDSTQQSPRGELGGDISDLF